MKEFIFTSGRVEIDGSKYRVDYLKVCIKNGDDILVRDKAGNDITIEILLMLAGINEHNALDLLSLISKDTYYDIIKCGSVESYKRRLN